MLCTENMKKTHIFLSHKHLHSVDSRGFWVPYVEAWHNVVEAMPLSCHLANWKIPGGSNGESKNRCLRWN